jgi:hypothetical protein
VVAVAALHVVSEVGTNEARGDWEKANCGEPHSVEWVGLSQDALDDEHGRKSKKGGGGPSETNKVMPKRLRVHPAKMETHDGVQVISGPCRTDTGITGPQKLNFHLD